MIFTSTGHRVWRVVLLVIEISKLRIASIAVAAAVAGGGGYYVNMY